LNVQGPASSEQTRNPIRRATILREPERWLSGEPRRFQALERAELAMRVADRDLRAAEFLNHAAEQLAQYWRRV
jgi:hypothetical protein